MIEADCYEDVTRIRMSIEADGKPVYRVAAYLVDGLLIDTGCPHTAEELVGFLVDEELVVVVNTHFHEDHVGADRIIRERFGVDIFAHPDSVPLIDRVPELRPYQEYVWGCPEPCEVLPLGRVVETPRCRFEVIETGGHSPGHVTLVEMERGWCFSGDIFISERPKVIRADEDAAGLIASMRLLAELPCERLVLFTSMGKIFPQGREALLNCVAYLEKTGVRVRELAAAGHTIDDIRGELFGGGSSLAALTGGHFSTDNLIASLLRPR
jgi:hydroxyacylglutathione hydrolase